MYARNIATVVQRLVKRQKGADGKATGDPVLTLDPADEITKEILVADGGQIVHPRVQPIS
jgi:hypothetical protein